MLIHKIVYAKEPVESMLIFIVDVSRAEKVKVVSNQKEQLGSDLDDLLRLPIALILPHHLRQEHPHFFFQVGDLFLRPIPWIHIKSHVENIFDVSLESKAGRCKRTDNATAR